MKKKRFIVAILSVATALGFSLFIKYSLKAAADNEVKFNIYDVIEMQYGLGDTLSLSGGNGSADGQEYALTVSLTYPSGKQSAYMTYFLDEIGSYSLIYGFTANGTKYTTEKNFNVISTTKNLFTTTGGASVESNYPTPDYAAEKKENGARLNFSSSSDSITYSAAVDLTDNTSGDSLLEFIIAPENSGVQELKHYFIRFTDVTDENNWIEFRAEAAAWGYEQNVMVGVSHDGSEDIQFANSNHYRAGVANPKWTMGKFGTGSITHIRSTTYGAINGYPAECMKIYYDYTDKRMYVMGRAYVAAGAEGYVLPLADLDDPECVGDYVWSGFKSGKVKITFTVTALDKCHILLYKVDDTILTSEEIQTSAYKSDFNVDYQGYRANSLPYGVAGKTYPVFGATGFDNYGNVFTDLGVSVYRKETVGEKEIYNYVAVKNGRFETETAGTYNIVYSYNDAFGERREKTVKITVKDAYDIPLGYMVNAGINAEYNAGETVTLPDGEITGGSGNATATKKVLFGGEEITLFNAGIDDYFIPEKQGTYTVKYEIGDFIGGTATVTKDVAVSYSSAPVLEKPFIPDVMIKGRMYMLPSVKAYSYADSGKTEQPVKIYAGDTEISDGRYSPAATGNIAIKYQAGGATYEKTVVVREIPSKNSDRGAYCDYFFLFDNCVGSYSDNLYRLNANAAGTAKVSFSRRISTGSLSAQLTSVAKSFTTHNEKFSLIFTDSVYADKRVVFTIMPTIVNGEGVASLYVNGVKAGVMSGSVDGSKNAPLEITYRKSDRCAYDFDGNLISEIKNYADGSAFDCFPSGYVYVSAEFSDVASDFSIGFTKIANQTFSSVKIDRGMPLLEFAEEKAGTVLAEYGKEYEFGIPKVFDVFSDSVSLNITITAPDGSKLFDGSTAAAKKYVLDKFGTYVVKYSASDGSNVNEISFSVRILDETPKKITLSAAPRNEYAAGQEITFPAATSESGATCLIVIEHMETGKRYLASGGKFTFTRAGRYKITYMSYDDGLNTETKTYNVVVKEK